MKNLLLAAALISQIGFSEIPSQFTCRGTYNANLSTTNEYLTHDNEQFGLSKVTVQVSAPNLNLSHSEENVASYRTVRVLGTTGAQINDPNQLGFVENFSVGALGERQQTIRTNPHSTKISNYFILHMNARGIGSLQLNLTSGALRTYAYDVHCNLTNP